MIDKAKTIEDVNFIAKSMAMFIEYYNENIPDAFPHATIKALEKFQETHPTLFKGGNTWTIDRHRKKLMEWLGSYQESA